MDALEKARADVEKGARAAAFRDSEFGKQLIGWYNLEIRRLTNMLVEDADLDADNVKRAAVRGELQAYLLLAKKLNFIDTKAQAGRIVLDENGESALEDDEEAPHAGK